MLAVFWKEMVQAKRIDTDLNKALNQVQFLRQLADYSAEPPALDKAIWAVDQAEAFLAEIQAKFGLATPKAKRTTGTKAP